jgi:hypothetical protein
MRATEWVRGGAPRALAVLALGVAAVPLLWGAGGCAKQERIAPAQPMPANLVDLPTLMTSVRTNASPWTSLDADCSLIIVSPQINTPTRQVSFAHAHLQIEKPGKIRLEAEEGQRRITLVGDGSQYRVDLPVFNDGYQGSYGDPLPVQPSRILFMPDDLVTAWDWAGLFVNKVPVLKNLPGGAVLDLLSMVEQPTPDLKASSTIVYNRAQQRITSAIRYSSDGAERSEISAVAVSTIEGPDKQPVRVPQRVRLTYPVTFTAIEIYLRNIKVNVQFPKGTFDVKS